MYNVFFVIIKIKNVMHEIWAFNENQFLLFFLKQKIFNILKKMRLVCIK